MFGFRRSSTSKGTTIVELTGGLGNQMFQIAAGMSHALQNGNSFVANSISMDFYIGHDGNVLGTPEQYKTEVLGGISLINGEIRAPVYVEPHYHYAKIPEARNIYIKGYFQSEKYFKQHEDVIRNLFTPTSGTKRYLFNKYGPLLSSSTTVSLHVRRGDYLCVPDAHPLAPTQYYVEAQAMFTDATFLVFSNDIPWCRENLPKGKAYVFVEDNEDYQDLFLMSMCDHNIIANSSFSWWGAWLNANEKKRVIAPSTWFGPRLTATHDTRDVVPDDWTVL